MSTNARASSNPRSTNSKGEPRRMDRAISIDEDEVVDLTDIPCASWTNLHPNYQFVYAGPANLPTSGLPSTARCAHGRYVAQHVDKSGQLVAMACRCPPTIQSSRKSQPLQDSRNATELNQSFTINPRLVFPVQPTVAKALPGFHSQLRNGSDRHEFRTNIPVYSEFVVPTDSLPHSKAIGSISDAHEAAYDQLDQETASLQQSIRELIHKSQLAKRAFSDSRAALGSPIVSSPGSTSPVAQEVQHVILPVTQNISSYLVKQVHKELTPALDFGLDLFEPSGNTQVSTHEVESSELLHVVLWIGDVDPHAAPQNKTSAAATRRTVRQGLYKSFKERVSIMTDKQHELKRSGLLPLTACTVWPSSETSNSIDGAIGLLMLSSTKLSIARLNHLIKANLMSAVIKILPDLPDSMSMVVIYRRPWGDPDYVFADRGNVVGLTLSREKLLKQDRSVPYIVGKLITMRGLQRASLPKITPALRMADFPHNPDDLPTSPSQLHKRANLTDVEETESDDHPETIQSPQGTGFDLPNTSPAIMQHNQPQSQSLFSRPILPKHKRQKMATQ